MATLSLFGMGGGISQAQSTYHPSSSWDLSGTVIGQYQTDAVAKAAMGAIESTAVGQANGVAGLDANGDVTAPINSSSVTATTATATALDGGVTATGSTVSRKLSIRMGDVINVLDYGVVADGATDNTTAIQAAVTAACASTSKPGGVLFFPAGKYAISAGTGISMVCAGLTIQGTGGGAEMAGGTEFIIKGSGSVPIFYFDAAVQSGNRYFYGGRVSDVAFVFANTTTSITQTGPAVKFSHCMGCELDHVFTANGFNTFEAYAGFKNRFHEFVATQQMSSPTINGGYAVYFHGDETGTDCTTDIDDCPTRGDVTEIFDFHIDEALSSASGFVPGNCIHLSDFAATTWIRHGTCNQAHIALNVDCPTSATASACPEFIHIDRFETEINATGDVDGSACLATTDVTHLESYSFQCYGYNQPTNLIRMIGSGKFSGIGHMEFYGGKIDGAAEACVSAAVKDVKFIGGDIVGCNQSGTTYSSTGSAFGILFEVAATGESADDGSFVVSGVNFCNGPASPSASFGGIRIDSGVAYGSVVGNIFRGCSAGVVDNSGETVNYTTTNAGP